MENEKKNSFFSAVDDDIVGGAKAVVADPEAGAGKFVSSVSWIGIALLTAVYALIDLLYGVWSKVKANIEYKNDLEERADDMDLDLDEYLEYYEDLDIDIETYVYSAGDIFKGVFMDILQAAAYVAIVALVVFFAVKFIKKTQITWKNAFAIATIQYLVWIPFMIVYRILDFIPDFKLWGWILSAISSVRVWGCTIITFLGLKSVCEDVKSTVYTYVPAVAVISIVSALVSFILGSIF